MIKFDLVSSEPTDEYDPEEELATKILVAVGHNGKLVALTKYQESYFNDFLNEFTDNVEVDYEPGLYYVQFKIVTRAASNPEDDYAEFDFDNFEKVRYKEEA